MSEDTVKIRAIVMVEVETSIPVSLYNDEDEISYITDALDENEYSRPVILQREAWTETGPEVFEIPDPDDYCEQSYRAQLLEAV